MDLRSGGEVLLEGSEVLTLFWVLLVFSQFNGRKGNIIGNEEKERGFFLVETKRTFSVAV